MYFNSCVFAKKVRFFRSILGILCWIGIIEKYDLLWIWCSTILGFMGCLSNFYSQPLCFFADFCLLMEQYYSNQTWLQRVFLEINVLKMRSHYFLMYNAYHILADHSIFNTLLDQPNDHNSPFIFSNQNLKCW